MKKMSNNPLIGGLTRMRAAQKERIARRLKALDAKWLPADQSFYKVEWLGELYEFTSVRELEDWIRSTAKDNNLSLGERVGRPKEIQGRYTTVSLPIREDLLAKIDASGKSRREYIEASLEQ